MVALRLSLVALFCGLFAYTVAAVNADGVAAIAVFVDDIVAVGWRGQFNLDFLCFLLIAGTWVAWRDRFSGAGLACAVGTLCGGALFFTVWLCWASLDARGDARVLMLGRSRAGT